MSRTSVLARYRRADGSDLLLLWTERGARHVTLAGQVEFAYDLMSGSRPVAAKCEICENVLYVRGRHLEVTGY